MESQVSTGGCSECRVEKSYFETMVGSMWCRQRWGLHAYPTSNGVASKGVHCALARSLSLQWEEGMEKGQREVRALVKSVSRMIPGGQWNPWVPLMSSPLRRQTSSTTFWAVWKCESVGVSGSKNEKKQKDPPRDPSPSHSVPHTCKIALCNLHSQCALGPHLHFWDLGCTMKHQP